MSSNSDFCGNIIVCFFFIFLALLGFFNYSKLKYFNEFSILALNLIFSTIWNT